jgi:hypothetical protein
VGYKFILQLYTVDLHAWKGILCLTGALFLMTENGANCETSLC